jgi:hypothetical protein
MVHEFRDDRKRVRHHAEVPPSHNVPAETDDRGAAVDEDRLVVLDKPGRHDAEGFLESMVFFDMAVEGEQVVRGFAPDSPPCLRIT